MKKMVRTAGMLAAALCLVAAATAAQTKKNAGSVTGTWAMTVKAQGAHGEMAASMTLKQQEKKVTGRFAAHGNDQPVEGEFADGKLKLATTDGGDHQITLTATLKDDGTLAGYLSGPMGDLQWTATRSNGK